MFLCVLTVERKDVTVSVQRIPPRSGTGMRSKGKVFNILSYLCETRKETGCGLLVLAYKHSRVQLYESN